MITFMEIGAVTEFLGEISTRRNWRVFRHNCRNKVAGEMGVRWKAGLFQGKRHPREWITK